MSIGKNIAKYRKLKGFTQEELGERIGVTNQAVSKWEQENSMPDVMLLPKIAEVLEITLNDLYGIENQKVCADNFPAEAYSLLCKFFYDQCEVKFSYLGKTDREQLEGYFEALCSGKHLTCISDTSGVVDISRDFAIIDTAYKSEGSEEIISSAAISRALNNMSDEHTRKVFAYQYSKSCENSDTSNRAFVLKEICDACGISKSEALGALEKLTALRLIEEDAEKTNTAYYFKKSQAFYVLAIYKLAQMLTTDKVHQVLRDTSTIDDYTF